MAGHEDPGMSRSLLSISTCSVLASAGWSGLSSCLPATVPLILIAAGFLTTTSFRIYAFASFVWHVDICWTLQCSFEPCLFVTYYGGGLSRWPKTAQALHPTSWHLALSFLVQLPNILGGVSFLAGPPQCCKGLNPPQCCISIAC